MGKWIKTSNYEGECRRSNGSSKLVWWIMTGASGIIFTGFLTWMTALNAKMEMLTSSDMKREGQISSLLKGETESERRFTSFEARLTRIEDKQDALLELVKHRAGNVP